MGPLLITSGAVVIASVVLLDVTLLQSTGEPIAEIVKQLPFVGFLLYIILAGARKDPVWVFGEAHKRELLEKERQIEERNRQLEKLSAEVNFWRDRSLRQDDRLDRTIKVGEAVATELVKGQERP